MANQLKTKELGVVKYDQDEIIKFKQGIPGFEDEKEFLLLQNADDESFYWLQSVKNPELTFLTTNAWIFISDYEFDLPENSKRELKIEDKNDILTLNVVVLPENIKEMSINLRAPIVINTNQKTGKQIILSEERYPIRYYPFKEKTKVEDQLCLS